MSNHLALDRGGSMYFDSYFLDQNLLLSFYRVGGGTVKTDWHRYLSNPLSQLISSHFKKGFTF